MRLDERVRSAAPIVVCVIGVTMFAPPPVVAQVCDDMTLPDVVHTANNLAVVHDSSATAVTECYRPNLQRVTESDVENRTDALTKERFLFEYIDTLLRYADTVGPDEAKVAFLR